jgi:Uma2 family endonuclease
MPTLVSESDKVERTLWTARDFLEWLKPGVHADLIDGEKFTHSPVNFRHARLLNFLFSLMHLYVERNKLGEVHREVVAVRLSTRNVFLPDVACFTPEQIGRLAESHAPFAPALVVEVLAAR